MGTIELLLTAIGLSMDAFAISICKGLAMPMGSIRKSIVIGLWFGGFQALMPLIGFYLGAQFCDQIAALDHWVVFILLLIIGVNMIRESREGSDENENASIGFRVMLVLAVATSIDALAVGITFAFLNVPIYDAIFLIGMTTFVLSVIGVKVGNIFGSRYKSKAEFLGGVILVIIGTKILLEHLGVLS